jgi:glycosyltransferase involved in cell wall biosynthesis
MTIAIAHDYLTQRGGAERVVLSMAAAFPEAPIHTLLYEPATTFPEFDSTSVRPSALNRLPLLRRNHRLAFPVLAAAASRTHVEADVVVCSSSGWAHGVDTSGAKVVYCHAPARWLYQSDVYLRELGAGARAAAHALHGPLVRWDRRAAGTAQRYLVNSSHVARLVREVYGIEPEILPPPPVLTPGGARRQVEWIEPGFVLCVSRLLAYKNVDVVVEAFRQLPGERLVVVGDGPDAERLAALRAPNVTLLGAVDDATLRWLYAGAAGLVAASYEDYGLTPLEAASFGKPTAALRFGGFLDTIGEWETGLFFDTPEPGAVAAALRRLLARRWDAAALEQHAARYSRERFVGRLREVVEEAAQ